MPALPTYHEIDSNGETSQLMDTEISVLGPLHVSVAGVPVMPTAAKPRQLLAMLAINAGRVVTTTSLMEELWGEHGPRRAPGTLQTYVLQLRRLLRTALTTELTTEPDQTSKDILITRHTGYELDVDREAVDAVRYERLAAAGRAVGAAGDYRRAGELLTEALEMWHGPALVDVSTGSQLEIEVMRLSESRLTDLTLRIDVDLYLGRHQQLLGELAALCARHPFMENFRAQYILALYRSGRASQAMETYREMWHTARDQLGVEPGSKLRRLHQALLAGDTRIDDPKFLINSWAPTAIAS
jgi:DNA-binding SARP family transcriptional activator